jgi:hypothetical protein
MSHWAEVDESNIVIRVTAGDNNDPNGDEGYQWLIDNLGGTWIKTSYNARGGGFRMNFAGPGYFWDEANDRFIAPSPFPSFILNEETALWEAPIPYPLDGKPYSWVEDELNWQEIVIAEGESTFVPRPPYPEDGNLYNWDEESYTWSLVE